MIVAKHSTVVVNFRASSDLQRMYHIKHSSSFSLIAPEFAVSLTIFFTVKYAVVYNLRPVYLDTVFLCFQTHREC